MHSAKSAANAKISANTSKPPAKIHDKNIMAAASASDMLSRHRKCHEGRGG
eukprot:m.314859 g.314859  ORF g.314859 m.314859 type:complete len:51 (+) comp20274_c0_seq8:1829-1981(+)